MIKATIVGRLGQDAQIKTIGAREYLALTLASDQRVKDEFGQWAKSTQWVDVLWHNKDSAMAQYLKKGSAVSVHGTLSLSIYSGQDGYAKQGITLWADYIEFA